MIRMQLCTQINELCLDTEKSKLTGESMDVLSCLVAMDDEERRKAM